jgi:hypothetical protein
MKDKFLIIAMFLFLFSSCKSDDQKKKEANDVVEKFVHEVTLENYNAAYKLYPKFETMGSFWIPRDFEIESTIIEVDGSVSIYGNYKKGLQKNELKFTLNDIGDGYKINSSKGLSSFYNTPLFQFCKLKGYLVLSENDIDYDVNLTKVCKEHEIEFDLLINKCARFVSENVIMNKQLSNIYKEAYIDSYSGTISIFNSTGFDISSSAFNLELCLYQNDEVCERISLDNMYVINANSTVNKKLSYLSFSCRGSKYGFQATLKNKDNFASEIIDKLSYAERL